MTQIATSKEQSERLLNAGILETTADMYLHNTLVASYSFGDKTKDYYEWRPFVRQHLIKPPKDIIPAWSQWGLVDILKMLMNERDITLGHMNYYFAEQSVLLCIRYRNELPIFYRFDGDLMESLVRAIEFFAKFENKD
jgi:hypothetical protein